MALKLVGMDPVDNLVVEKATEKGRTTVRGSIEMYEHIIIKTDR